MRILLDESLPIELRDELPRHCVRSVREMGWSALRNGELLRRAAEKPLVPELLSALASFEPRMLFRVGT